MDGRIAEQRDFSADTRSSGVVLALGGTILKGAVDAIAAELPDGASPRRLVEEADAIAGRGATPLALRFDDRAIAA